MDDQKFSILLSFWEGKPIGSFDKWELSRQLKAWKDSQGESWKSLQGVIQRLCSPEDISASLKPIAGVVRTEMPPHLLSAFANNPENRPSTFKLVKSALVRHFSTPTPTTSSLTTSSLTTSSLTTSSPTSSSTPTIPKPSTPTPEPSTPAPPSPPPQHSPPIPQPSSSSPPPSPPPPDVDAPPPPPPFVLVPATMALLASELSPLIRSHRRDPRDIVRESAPMSAGAQALVYRATYLGQAVILRRSHEPISLLHFPSLQRFLQISCELSHPNLVAFLGWSVSAERQVDALFRPLDLTLNSFLNLKIDRVSLPASLMLRYADQLCAAIQALHLHNVVHRDVNFDNIMVSADRSFIQLIDLGIARFAAPRDMTRMPVREFVPGASSSARLFQHPSCETGEYGTPADVYSALGVMAMLFSGKRFSVQNQHAPKSMHPERRFDHYISAWEPFFQRYAQGFKRMLSELPPLEAVREMVAEMKAEFEKHGPFVARDEATGVPFCLQPDFLPNLHDKQLLRVKDPVLGLATLFDVIKAAQLGEEDPLHDARQSIEGLLHNPFSAALESDDVRTLEKLTCAVFPCRRELPGKRRFEQSMKCSAWLQTGRFSHALREMGFRLPQAGERQHALLAGLDRIFAVDLLGGVVSPWAGKMAECAAEYDHFFPYARGGESHVRNCIVLNKSGNRAKSSDIIQFMKPTAHLSIGAAIVWKSFTSSLSFLGKAGNQESMFLGDGLQSRQRKMVQYFKSKEFGNRFMELTEIRAFFKQYAKSCTLTQQQQPSSSNEK